MSLPSGASTTTRSSAPAQPGRPGPGQATNGTGHHGSSTARSSRESGPAATTARGRPSEAIAATAAVDGLGRVTGLATHAGTGLGQVAQHLVGAEPVRLVVEPRVVEEVGHGGYASTPVPPGRRASSTSSTGMSSRTG